MKDLKHKRSGLDIKFLPEFQGKWLATEALKLFIDLIFEIEEKERPDDMESAESYWELTKKRLCEIGKSNIFLLITGFNTNSSNKMSLTCSSRRLLRISPD